MWKPVVGGSRYEVSDHGRVRKADTKVILTLTPNNKAGHLAVGIKHDDDKWKLRYVHRLVLEAFVGPCPEGMESLHADDAKRNNHLANLRWGTRKENVGDRLRNGNDKNSRKTHCPQGHELSGDNLVPSQLARGSRSCKTCARAHSRAQKLRAKEKL